MRKLLCAALAIMALSMGSLKAQSPSVVYDSKTVTSKILGEERKYSVYLPEGYNDSERSYPVVYLLHPAGPAGTLPNQQAWIYYGEIKQYMDQAIKAGEIQPMILVTPDANGPSRISYYNDANGKFNFEDFFFQEFVPYIEKNYRIRTDKASRAIAGASAGGGAAVYYALHHPDMFSVCVGLSAAVRSWDEANMKTRFPDVQESKLREWYKQYDVFELFSGLQDSQKNQYLMYMDCGDDDALVSQNARLHDLLNKIGYKNELRVLDGAHNWTYWRKITPEFMQYISTAFKK